MVAAPAGWHAWRVMRERERVEAGAPAPATAPTTRREPPISASAAAVLDIQRAAGNQATVALLQRKKNNTGLPDNLKAGIEQLSGQSMDDVRVHYNSAAPAQLNAHAYAQGREIHLAPGQERHLPHEAWHVVQEQQGRVKPSMPVDPALAAEADEMGAKAEAHKPEPTSD